MQWRGGVEKEVLGEEIRQENMDQIRQSLVYVKIRNLNLNCNGKPQGNYLKGRR